MDKAPDAFRTISEVAESLETPAHVLRFWESRFPQIRPVKRAGGRRYYRPADVALLSGIRHLLHDEGMTIRGVQKILREQGVRHVAGMAAVGDAVDFDADVLEGQQTEAAIEASVMREPVAVQVFDLITPPHALARGETAPGGVIRLRSKDGPARDGPEPDGPEPEVFGPEVFEPEVFGPDGSRPGGPVVEGRPARSPLFLTSEAPEAGHVWVDDEPELELPPPTDLFTRPPPAPPGAEMPAVAAPAVVAPVVEPIVSLSVADPVAVSVPQLAGIAARLRALPLPVSAAVLPELMELHSRLGLLQAQMAEALRQRR